MDMTKLDSNTLEILDANGFKEIPFEMFQDRLKTNGFDPDEGRTNKSISHPDADMLCQYPKETDDVYSSYAKQGAAAIAAGEVAVVILNGGMATRFGGVPKGTVEVVNGRSFLDLKISQVLKAGAGKVPVVLMNSFATDGATVEHLNGLDLTHKVERFTQYVSLRMTQDGEVFIDDAGQPSLHAPGHGDFPFAIDGSGILKRLMDNGVKYVTLSNVDNLGAALDPVIIGMHIQNANPMSVELVKAYKGDVGGFPAIVDDKLAIMEMFRLPKDFDVNTISVFNTNTFIFDASALRDKPELDWFSVSKKVGDQQAIQFERLVGQMTEFVDVTWMVVPREGDASRFIPIKTREDIVTSQDVLVARLTSLDVL